MFLTYVTQMLKTQVTTLLIVVMSIAVSGCEMFVSPPAASLDGSSSATADDYTPQTLDPSREFYTGYYIDINRTTVAASAVCFGSTLFGVPGTAICQSGETSSPAGAADVATGKEYWNERGQKIIGTMTNGSSVTGEDGKLVISIPTGYYDGFKATTARDSMLIPTNIRKDTTVFGVIGNLVEESHIACTDNAQNAGSCSTATNRYVTAAAGSNVIGTPGSLSMMIPQGYYSGGQSATAVDANLTPSNICTSSLIFGTAGTAICIRGSTDFNATSADMLSGKEAWNSSGLKVTGGIPIKDSITGSSGALTILIPQGYYDGTKTATAVDNNLKDTNISKGVIIFGVTGAADSERHSDCTDNAMNAGSCATATGRYVTSIVGANISGDNGALQITIPQGFYTGGQKTIANDANLSASNICNTTNIFGVIGTAVCQQGGGSSGSGGTTVPGLADDLLLGKEAWTQTGTKMVGTIPIGSDFAGDNGKKEITIPKGYYDGTKKVTASDSTLIPANIMSGVSIFGVTGNNTPEAHSECTDNVLNAVACATATNRYVTATAGTSFDGGNGVLSVAIPQGFYDGTKTVSAKDSALIEANIRKGATIFGIVGNSVQESHLDCTDDELNAVSCATGTNRYVTSTVGSHITGNNASLSMTIPKGFYDGSKTATAIDSNLLATNVCRTTSIFGTTGSAVCEVGTTSNGAIADDLIINKEAWDSTGAKITGSIPLGTNFNGGEGESSILIPKGYYDGTKTVTPVDADLKPTNIMVGVTVLGVLGTQGLESHAACTDDAQNAGSCATETNRFVTATAGSNVTGPDGSLTFSIAQGYYGGTQTATAQDSNLVGSNICKTKTIFGQAGDAICQSGSTTSGATAADILQGKEAWDNTGTKVSGTLPIQTGMLGDDGVLVTNIIPGYYGVGSKMTCRDSTLVDGSNIVTGARIFGVAGSAVRETHSACTNNSLNANACFTAVNSYVTESLGTSVNVTSKPTIQGQLSINIPKGFHDGSTTTTASDVNLVTDNICTGRTIFGMTGSKVCQTGTGTNIATAADLIAGKEAWNHSGTKITGTIVNQGNFNALTSWPGAGYYGATPAVLPMSSDICAGVSIVGVIGTAPCSGGQTVVLYSNAFRDKATTPLSWSAEVNTGTCSDGTSTTRYKCESLGEKWTPSALPTGYRNVPQWSKDDDGYFTPGITSGEFTLAGRPTVNCGVTQDRILDRIADCATKNSSTSTWDGTNKGNGGFGVWKLVTRILVSTASKEVWQDQRTGLLWSSVVGSMNMNYCKASGAAWTGDTYCAPGSAYQTASPVSVCAEDTGLSPAVTGENWSTGIYNEAKGKMGKIGSSSSPSVIWRLPTINDFSQANINGIRFVMPDMIYSGGGGAEWSATLSVTQTAPTVLKNYAYRFTGSNGLISSTARTSSAPVRCVGR